MVGWGQESHRAQRGKSLTRPSQKGSRRGDHLRLILFPFCSYLGAMTLLLFKSSAQARIEAGTQAFGAMMITPSSMTRKSVASIGS
jgi:hypothetical protein